MSDYANNSEQYYTPQYNAPAAYANMPPASLYPAPEYAAAPQPAPMGYRAPAPAYNPPAAAPATNYSEQPQNIAPAKMQTAPVLAKRPAQLQKVQPVSVPSHVANSKVRVAVKSAKNSPNQIIKIYNVESPKGINIRSKNSLKVSPVAYNETKKTMKFSFVPDGQQHEFDIYDNDTMLRSQNIAPAKMQMTPVIAERPAPLQKVQPVSVPSHVANSKVRVAVKSAKNSPNKIIKIYNVESPKGINIRSKNSLKVSPVSHNEIKKTMKYSFVPDGEEHEFAVYDHDNMLKGHTLTPRPVALETTKEGPVVKNLYDAKKLKLLSDTRVEWDLVAQGNNQYKIRMNAFGETANIKLHTVDNSGNNHAVEGGNFELTPTTQTMKEYGKM